MKRWSNFFNVTYGYKVEIGDLIFKTKYNRGSSTILFFCTGEKAWINENHHGFRKHWIQIVLSHFNYSNKILTLTN